MDSDTALVLAIVGVAAWWIYTQEDDTFESNWECCSAAQPYLATINQAGQTYGLPANLLAAVAYAESSFNPNAVNAGSGAKGMFQLMPCYYPNAGQSWSADAATAAQALAGYANQFGGDWTLALAAYNWGPSNVQSNLADIASAVPSETSDYVNKIAAAVGLTGALYGGASCTGGGSSASGCCASYGCCCGQYC